MDKKTDNYNISFFRPTTKLAKFNRKITLNLLAVWVIAIFGFHIVLKVIEEPTPEPAYTEFEKVWEDISVGTATAEQEKIFVSSTLSVLGKLSISDKDKVVLNNAVSSSFFKLVPDSLMVDLKDKISLFATAQKDTTLSLSDPAYQKTKFTVAETASRYAGLEKHSLKAKLLPFVLNADQMTTLSDDVKGKVPTVMAKYLIHNQSFLTDFRFLGFPFHYFYTSVFLLVLFVGLCWIYCYRTDKMLSKFEVTESA